jgi:hypothetical protein
MKTIQILAAAILLILPELGYSQQGLNWVNYSGRLPANAVYGGYETNGNKLAVCRCNFQGSWHPGKVVAGKCNIGYGGREYAVSNFQVLTQQSGVRIRWQPVSGNNMPGNAFVGGVENGRKLYVGVGFYPVGGATKPGRHPGKIFLSGNQYTCNIGYGGREIVLQNNILVLVVEGGNTQRTSAGTAVNCTHLAGTWAWISGVPIVLTREGAIQNTDGEQWGRWKCNKKSKLVLMWRNDTKNVMEIANQNLIFTQNENGRRLESRRMSDEEVKMYKEMKGYQDTAEDVMNKVRDFFKKN